MRPLISTDTKKGQFLNSRSSDRLDIKEVACWNLKNALLAAYRAGQKDAKKEYVDLHLSNF